MAVQSSRDVEMRAASVGETPVLNGQIVLAQTVPARR